MQKRWTVKTWSNKSSAVRKRTKMRRRRETVKRARWS